MSQPVKTMRFTREELALLVQGMDFWFQSGESTREEYDRMWPLIDRLRHNLADLNWKARQAALAAETPEQRAERQRKNNELVDLSRRWAGKPSAAG